MGSGLAVFWALVMFRDHQGYTQFSGCCGAEAGIWGLADVNFVAHPFESHLWLPPFHSDGIIHLSETNILGKCTFWKLEHSTVGEAFVLYTTNPGSMS